MYEKPSILSEEQRMDPKYVCGVPGCSCESVMNDNEKYCHSIGAYYCWCKEGTR